MNISLNGYDLKNINEINIFLRKNDFGKINMLRNLEYYFLQIENYD
jgi:hypothetical protein